MEFHEIISKGAIVLQSFPTTASMVAATSSGGACTENGRVCYVTATKLVYVYDNATAEWVEAGKPTFLQLDDTPSTYSGYNGYYVCVSGSELIFKEVSNGDSVKTNITQASHGFTTYSVVRLDGANYVKAIADDSDRSEAIGIVTSITSSNEFELTTSGKFSISAALFTPGTVYFLSESTSGSLTSTEPTASGTVSKPVVIADTTTSGYFVNMRGSYNEESSDSSGTGVKVTISQIGHGLSIYSLVRLNGVSFVKAIATTSANAEVVGIVTEIVSDDEFVLTTYGRVDIGVPLFTPGTVYFLSDSTAGSMTSVEPTTAGYISKPVFIADTTSTGFFINMRGTVVVESGTSVGIPIGSVIAFTTDYVPDGYLECDGSSYSKTTYAELYSALSSGAIYGQDTNTFQVPDYRGLFLRGTDGGRGQDPDASSRMQHNFTGTLGDTTGSVQNGQIEAHNHYIPANVGIPGYPIGFNGQYSADPVTESIGGNETRPVNVYVTYCIKYTDEL